jgi:2-hydroxy-3-keto-5-methylthiopentenyl-1-phosphate phosphatase
MTGKPIIALLYDFDKTLCTTDMQNYSFIPSLNIKPKEFWAAADALSKKEHMDELLAYMYLMIQEAKKRNLPINRESFVQMGKGIKYFPGVEKWFPRIDAYGASKGVEIQHYVISSGNEEIIEGSSIFKYFKKVFACEYLYVDNVAVWPKTVVNYTTKTQFLFRINKGVLDIAENNKVNESTPDEEKPVPFQNMVYIADGLTDVPCMKLVKANGGSSIAVYGPGKKPIAKQLFNDGRVDFLTEADYSEGGHLETIIKAIIDKMESADKLMRMHFRQTKENQ